jgi:hypothetical protein
LEAQPYPGFNLLERGKVVAGAKDPATEAELYERFRVSAPYLARRSQADF